MKGILVLLLLCTLSACSAPPKPADPFEAAIQASIGAMAGGIMGVNAGGGR